MTTTRVDMHVKVLDERVVERAKRRGLDVLVYAPHFVRLPDIRDRASRFSDDDLLVVPARELFTEHWRSRKHILAVGLDYPVPDFVTLDGAIAELEDQNAATLIPHPEFLSVSLSESDIETYRDNINGVEVYNPKHWPRDNRRAREIAARTGVPEFTSSYAHLRGTVGEAYTEFDRDIDSERDLVDALREGADRRVVRRSGGEHTFRCAAEFAHLGWENSWKKLDRIVLSGTAPTHPSHPAYAGEFADIAVYE